MHDLIEIVACRRTKRSIEFASHLYLELCLRTLKGHSKHITVLVSNDLEFDQRVAKVCHTLLELGFEITLVGRMMEHSKAFERPYEIKRFRLPFSKGALFYASLNIRLFFYLLFKKTDIILANDLDTLWPAVLVGKWRNKKVIYDSHEYFTEAEGLTGRAFQKRVWEWVERRTFRKADAVYTVNESFAAIYRKKYNREVSVVRNIPPLKEMPQAISKSSLGLREDQRVLLLQGAFIDPDRGGMEMAQAMEFLPDYVLYIIGSGRDIPNIKSEVMRLNIADRVLFRDRLPYDELRQYTAMADLGVSLDKPLHLNYTLSLPNKLFDYIHAGTPVMVSDLPELKRIVLAYEVGIICPEVTPKSIASTVRTAFETGQLEVWKSKCIQARNVLNWQEESKELHRIYRPLL